MATSSTATRSVKVGSLAGAGRAKQLNVEVPDYGRRQLEDTAFLTSMLLVLLGNYSQTGHFGGPLAYTPYNVAVHLVGPELGGLAYDLRHPKHPNADNFMLAGGHCIPTCYALWIVLCEALERQRAATGDERFATDPGQNMLSVDAIGFRRGAGALATILEENGLTDHPLFAQAKGRGIRALAGHAETTDMTNDVNGGPSGIGFSTSAGKAMFWDFAGSPAERKTIVFEGEMALTEGHAQEIKTIALAQKVGKRLRVMNSFNNAGIDDSLLDGVIDAKYTDYSLPQQWASYGWNVLTLENGNDLDQVVAALKAMEDWDISDRRPMITIGRTLKGWWPGAVDGRINGHDQIVDAASHPYTLAMNSPYFLALASSFEQRYGVEFAGIHDGVPGSERDRLIEFKTNVDTVLSVLDGGLGAWLAERLVAIGEALPDEMPARINLDKDPFQDERLAPENLPRDEITVSSAGVESQIRLFRNAGEKAGTRRAISELGKWLNYVTDNRFITIAADLSDSINVENAHFTHEYDAETNPGGTRLRAGIEEAGNAGTIAGLVSQSLSADPDRHAGVWGLTGTYGAFTPLMYTPVRVFSQQNQDSPFANGVLTVLAGHSGPETAADARTHFGIFAPQVWTMFPRGQIINLYFWDYNDVAPGYFAAVHHAARQKEAGVIVIHVARPDFLVADRAGFADTDVLAAGRGAYVIRDFDPAAPPQGTVYVQGSSSTNNLVSVIPQLEDEGINVRIVAVISEDLLRLQDPEYQQRILSDADRFDCTFVTTMTKRVPPLSNLGPFAEQYALSSDFDDRWRTGGTEADVIAESRLDPESILEGIRRFAAAREERISLARNALSQL
ncbi:MAG: hypothetical protein OXP37_07615 [Chloroflexota bacterium]|nr:hypothetical protein [Chloroflexota bacterium]MXW27686.1 hypothetical protein [Chloroflexota bacterium]MYC47992.1 hypothetical protein [Chloroflexota bacterium]